MPILYLLAAKVSVEPIVDCMPGAAVASEMLSWLGQLALWGSLARFSSAPPSTACPSSPATARGRRGVGSWSWPAW